MSFQWQTDDEDKARWSGPDAAGPPASTNRRWWVLLLTVCLAGAAIYGVYREGQERVEENVARVQEDVLASHRLGRQALERGDREMFVQILSGRDAAWTETQKERLARGLLYEQTPRVLGLVPVGAEEDAVPAVTLSADLREATVTWRHDYLVPAEGISETVALTETAVYRRGANRWLLAPPAGDDFWGSWRTREYDTLSLTYPRREEAVAGRLARDLDEKVAEMCSHLDCPPDFRAQVRLERTPQSVLSLSNPEESLYAGRGLSLPAPTLVGLPADDAAYQALFRGYARFVLSVLLVDLGEWACCDHALFHQALLYRQLAALGVAPEPVRAADYLSLLDPLPDLAQMRRWAWDTDPVARPAAIPVAVYAFLEFLLEEEDADLWRFRPSLEGALIEWLFDYGGGLSLSERDEAWARFARTSLQRAQADIPLPPGLALPEQDLLLACPPQPEASAVASDSSAATFSLYRYGHASEQWTRESEWDTEFVLLTVLPDDDGFFLAGPPTEEGDLQQENKFWLRTYLQRPGADPVLVAGGAGHADMLYPWPWSDPGGERLLVAVFHQGESETDPSFGLVDPDSCSAQGCPYEPLPGFPFWSPDGRQMLTMSFEDPPAIQRRAAGDGGWQEVGQGRAPFWLDNLTYGFVREDEIWVGTVAEDRPSLWLTRAMIEDVRPAGAPGVTLSFNTVLRHPLAADRLLLIADSTREQSDLYLFGRERAGDAWPPGDPFIRHLATLPGRVADMPPVEGLVAAGRPWLVLPDSGGESGLWIYDLAEEKLLLSLEEAGVSALQLPFDWSADGTWLARPAMDAVELIAPAVRVDGRPYRRFIFHELGDCSAVGWINPG